jgi:IS605 OrfB family transposase
MRIVALAKILGNPEESKLLRDTLEQANACCNWISAKAWEARCFRQFDLHKLVYGEARLRFGLSAQVVIRCISKVADAYKLDKIVQRRFRKWSAQPFDDRIFRIINNETISIWTLQGRKKIKIAVGKAQADLVKLAKGEVDLIFRDGKWLLAIGCEVPDKPLTMPDDVIGVDLGIKNISTDSTGRSYTGAVIETCRKRYSRRRKALQSVGTRSAKRRLKALRRRQSLFQRDVNHRIAKALVGAAEGTGCGLALEELKGIRKRVTVRRQQRARHSNWGFSQLRAFVAYKAQRRGVLVVMIDPRNTSRTCPCCGHVAKSNRRTRDMFECQMCGHAGPADYTAALNIQSSGRRKLLELCAGDQVNDPMVQVAAQAA